MNSLFLAVAASVVVVLPSFAQQTPDIVTEEVVVTATRFEDRKADQPIGVQVITSEQIRDSGARTLPELLGRQAGIYSRDNSGSPNYQIDLRGFGIFGDQNVLILVDGQRISENEQIPANLSAIALSVVERVEVVRGSGAVLYGAGATAGVINIITRAPRPNGRSVALRGGYGTYATREAGASAELSGERVGMTVNATRHLSDNYRHNNEVAQTNGEATFRYFGEAGDVTLRVASSSQDLRLPGARTEAQLITDRRGATTPNDFSELKARRANLALTTQSALGELALDLGYRDRQSFSEQFGGLADIEGNVISASPRVRTRFDLMGRANALVIGADWEAWDYETRAAFGSFSSSADSRQRNVAVYFKDMIEFTPRAAGSLGVRWQKADTELNDALNVPSSLNQSENLRAYELAMRYRLTQALTAYGRAGESFRMPTVDDNRFRSSLLLPQTSLDREIGAELSLYAIDLRLSVYQMRIRNEILFLPADLLPPFGSNVNLPPTRRQGIEMEMSWPLGEAFLIAANYVYSEAKFREGDFGSTNVAGKTIPLVPRHRAAASAAWRLTERARAIGTVTYTGEQQYDNDQSNSFGRRMPDYTVVDLVATLGRANWTFSAAVRNLLNEQYYTYAIRNTTQPTFNAYPAPERSFFLSAEYRFGD